jgi:triphosphoribosyl-dephospho-CoA synthase
MMSATMIEAAFRDACAAELAAPKPGNVHVFADGHGMTVEDFRRSAAAAAPGLCRPGARLGERILAAVEATRTRVGQNTNLGIILLSAPLVMAAETNSGDLRTAVRGVLESADVTDTGAIFAAIRCAGPAGLGDSPTHDVRAPAAATPLVTMAVAADRDSIARQWVSGFAEVFGTAMDAYRAARSTWPEISWAPLAPYLWFLASMPDSHVMRKWGAAEAARLCAEAAVLRERLATPPDLATLLSWDRTLKRRGINPGTSADLTVAVVLAERLRRAPEQGH